MCEEAIDVLQCPLRWLAAVGLIVATFVMPFHAIGATPVRVERLADSDRVRFTLKVNPDDLSWSVAAGAGAREAQVAVVAAALGSVFANYPLASQAGTWRLTRPITEASKPRDSTVQVTLDVPPRTRTLRFVLRDLTNGRMGTVNIDPASLKAAPFTAPQAPGLERRPVVPSPALNP